jgi:hypothetical protein
MLGELPIAALAFVGAFRLMRLTTHTAKALAGEPDELALWKVPLLGVGSANVVAREGSAQAKWIEVLTDSGFSRCIVGIDTATVHRSDKATAMAAPYAGFRHQQLRRIRGTNARWLARSSRTREDSNSLLQSTARFPKFGGRHKSRKHEKRSAGVDALITF